METGVTNVREAPRLADAVRRAYGIIGRATPLKADCGALCGAICCKDANEAERAASKGAAVESGAAGQPSAAGESAAAGQPCVADQSGAAEQPDATGMFLFPGEYGLVSQAPGFRFFRILYMGEPAWFLVCEGVCERRKRPVACRVYPLSPYIGADGAVSALPDPRAKRVCPLADGEFLSPVFRRVVQKAFRELAAEPEIFAYMKALSADLDDMRRFYKNRRSDG